MAIINNEISEWTRPNAFKSTTELNEIAYDSFYRNMTKQIPQRFQHKHITATAKKGVMGLGTRSSVVSDLLVDDAIIGRIFYLWIMEITLSSTCGYNKNG